MKIEKTFTNQVVETTGVKKKMKLAENSQATIFKMFTDNIYSDQIGSFIRELTSNCYDSHKEAHVNELVEVELNDDPQNPSISFIDVGVGISPDRMDNIYSTYFESTKNDSNDEIGGFGLGAKTPLAYKRYLNDNEYDNTYYILTRYNGIEYLYTIFEGAESPEFSLNYEISTTKRNGTKVTVPLSINDLKGGKIISSIRYQLQYFENIIFTGFENYDKNINNYKLFKGKSFIYRPDTKYSSMHLCLGQVSYPIDFNKLGLSEYDYKIPIGILANIGDVNVTVSRESLDYNDKVIDFLKSKIQLAKDELKTLLEKEYSNVRTLFDFYRIENNPVNIVVGDDIELDLSLMFNHRKFKLKNFKYKKFFDSDELIPRFENLLSVITFKFKVSATKNVNTFSKNKIGKNINLNVFNQNENIFYAFGSPKRENKKIRYLKDIHNLFAVYHIYSDLKDVNAIDSEFVKTTFYKVLIKNKPELEPLVIEMLKEVYNKLITDKKDFTKLEIPQWFIEQEKNNRTKASKKTFIIHRLNPYNTSKSVINQKYLERFNGTIVYGNMDSDAQIRYTRTIYEKFYDTLHYSKQKYTQKFNDYLPINGIMFVKVAQNNIKYLKNLDNSYTHNEFINKYILKRKAKRFREYGEYLLIKPQIDKIHSFYLNYYNLLPASLKKKVLALENYRGDLTYKMKEYIYEILHVEKTKTAIEKIQDKPSKEMKQHLKTITKLIELTEKNQTKIDFFRFSGENQENPDFLDLIKRELIS